MLMSILYLIVLNINGHFGDNRVKYKRDADEHNDQVYNYTMGLPYLCQKSGTDTQMDNCDESIHLTVTPSLYSYRSINIKIRIRPTKWGILELRYKMWTLNITCSATLLSITPPCQFCNHFAIDEPPHHICYFKLFSNASIWNKGPSPIHDPICIYFNGFKTLFPLPTYNYAFLKDKVTSFASLYFGVDIGETNTTFRVYSRKPFLSGIFLHIMNSYPLQIVPGDEKYLSTDNEIKHHSNFLEKSKSAPSLWLSCDHNFSAAQYSPRPINDPSSLIPKLKSLVYFTPVEYYCIWVLKEPFVWKNFTWIWPELIYSIEDKYASTLATGTLGSIMNLDYSSKEPENIQRDDEFVNKTSDILSYNSQFNQIIEKVLKCLVKTSPELFNKPKNASKDEFNQSLSYNKEKTIITPVNQNVNDTINLALVKKIQEENKDVFKTLSKYIKENENYQKFANESLERLSSTPLTTFPTTFSLISTLFPEILNKSYGYLISDSNSTEPREDEESKDKRRLKKKMKKIKKMKHRKKEKFSLRDRRRKFRNKRRWQEKMNTDKRKCVE